MKKYSLLCVSLILLLRPFSSIYARDGGGSRQDPASRSLILYSGQIPFAVNSTHKLTHGEREKATYSEVYEDEYDEPEFAMELTEGDHSPDKVDLPNSSSQSPTEIETEVHDLHSLAYTCVGQNESECQHFTVAKRLADVFEAQIQGNEPPQMSSTNLAEFLSKLRNASITSIENVAEDPQTCREILSFLVYALDQATSSFKIPPMGPVIAELCGSRFVKENMSQFVRNYVTAKYEFVAGIFTYAGSNYLLGFPKRHSLILGTGTVALLTAFGYVLENLNQ